MPAGREGGRVDASSDHSATDGSAARIPRREGTGTATGIAPQPATFKVCPLRASFLLDAHW